MIDMNEYEWTRTQEFCFYAAMLIAGIVISFLLYRNIIFAVVIVPFIRRIKSYITATLIENRKRNYLTQFKDFLFMASTGIGAGRSMKDAIGEAIPSLEDIYGKSAVLVVELKKAYERMNVGGENDVDVLMDMAILSRQEDCMDFATIYSICKTTGASLIIALNKAASVIIDKMTIEREIRELVNRKETEGSIIFVMPILVVLFLNLCAPEYIAPMYETVAGRIIMTMSLAGNIAIYGLIQKIVNIKI